MSRTARPLLESRGILAAYLGEWVRCRAVAMRDGTGKNVTFVTRLDVWLGGQWVRTADHAWLTESRLCRDFGRGVVLDFDAQVRTYRSHDPATGHWTDRYGLYRPLNVVPLGPAPLLEMVRELCEVWGWERVADAIEQQHGG